MQVDLPPSQEATPDELRQQYVAALSAELAWLHQQEQVDEARVAAVEAEIASAAAPPPVSDPAPAEPAPAPDAETPGAPEVDAVAATS